MKLKDIGQTRDQLKPFLTALLNSRGHEINQKGFFRCPAHDEKEPSAHFIPGTDDQKWFCMGCQAGGDFFDAIHFTDGLPLSGPGWVKETMPKACSEFGVPLVSEQGEVSADEQQDFDFLQAYEKASRLLLGGTTNSAECAAKLAEYGWSSRTLRVFGIGGVASSDKFLRQLVKQGFSKEFIKEIGLADTRIFSPECLIFTIKDQWGRPVGFSARYLGYEKQEARLKQIRDEKGRDSQEYKDAAKQAKPKYVNTSTHKFYKKHEVLLGLHAARGTSKTLYVFEGNSDLITAFDKGLINSVAVCGSAFSEKHFQVALDNGFTHFVFVMDGDAGGRQATSRISAMCAAFLADKQQVRAEIVDLSVSEEKVDPDSFLRSRGLAEFRQLPRRSYQYWLWKERLEASDNLTVAGEAATLIATQPDPLLRYDMLSNLHALTSIPMEVLWETVVRMAQKSESETARQILSSVSWMQFMRKHAEDAKRAIERARAVEVNGMDTVRSSLLASGLAPMKRAPKQTETREAVEKKTAAAASAWE